MLSLNMIRDHDQDGNCPVVPNFIENDTNVTSQPGAAYQGL